VVRDETGDKLRSFVLLDASSAFLRFREQKTEGVQRTAITLKTSVDCVENSEIIEKTIS
jgi:hypothetical protein